MKETGGADLEACFRAGYKLAVAKEADAETVAVLQTLYEQAEAELQNGPPNVQTIAYREDRNDPQVSDPMTVVANALMNLDAFLTRE